jgi:hypothetical protein
MFNEYLGIGNTIKFVLIVGLVMVILEIICLTLFGGASYPVGTFINSSDWSREVPALAW